MPEITKLEIENFKGIERAEIDLEGRTSSPILTLIGLNESGKTTILEALSHFVSGDRSVASLFEGSYAVASGLKLIPMHRKAAFTGKVVVRAHIRLDDSDVEDLCAIANAEGISLDASRIQRDTTVARVFQFTDSNLQEPKKLWGLKLYVKGRRGSVVEYVRPSDESGEIDVWLACCSDLESKLQRISYFPTFLVELPARIYLEEHSDEERKNRHYRYVFKDILESMGEGLSLERHVCARIREFKQKQNDSSWISLLFGSPDKGPIDSVFQKISSQVTREVLGSWQKIFQRSISAKNIVVDWSIDAQKNDMPYATFSVSDGESKFAVNERSLGFRWFFSFLLFTAFKSASQRKTIFLFDEPAANLHAKAQAELLKSFSRIAGEGNKIIYSTHSHHMIEPRWLGSAYIVENSALDYDVSDSFGLDTKPTKISVTPYRRFVSDYPTRSSYFQPVIEKLEYVVPEVVGHGPCVVVEGITDYYALRLACVAAGKEPCFSIVPGSGSAASGPLISQLLGSGRKFIILLDDDHEGKRAAKRYKDDWFLPEGVALTLGDLDPSFSGSALEKLLDEETLIAVADRFGAKGRATKKQIGWYLAEACSASDPREFMKPQALSAFLSIIAAVEAKIR